MTMWHLMYTSELISPVISHSGELISSWIDDLQTVSRTIISQKSHWIHMSPWFSVGFRMVSRWFPHSFPYGFPKHQDLPMVFLMVFLTHHAFPCGVPKHHDFPLFFPTFPNILPKHHGFPKMFPKHHDFPVVFPRFFPKHHGFPHGVPAKSGPGGSDGWHGAAPTSRGLVGACWCEGKPREDHGKTHRKMMDTDDLSHET